MGILKSALLGGCTLAIFATAAAAADLRPTIVDKPMLPVIESSHTSGWYLRGDVGGGVASGGSFYLNPLTSGLSDPDSTITYDYTHYSGQWFVGAGIGYQHGWLRGDATFELRGGGRFMGRDTYSDDPNDINGRNAYSGDMSAMVGLINIYADLGTWHGVTPYIGAGVGMARVTMGEVQDSGFSQVGAGPITPTNGYFLGASRTNFAWALMAGLSYEVNERLTMDLGYRYLNVGKYSTGGLSCAGSCPDPLPGLHTGSIAYHDVRFGMRWALYHEAAPVAEMPVIRKY
jgi:opacity protein-like surface antigen